MYNMKKSKKYDIKLLWYLYGLKYKIISLSNIVEYHTSIMYNIPKLYIKPRGNMYDLKENRCFRGSKNYFL